MSRYLFVESRDPYESRAVLEHVQLAARLERRGCEVALFLVQNAVLPVRAGADDDAVQPALTAGVEVSADDFSLRERGIGEDELIRGVRPASLELVVDRLAAGWKVLFL